MDVTIHKIEKPQDKIDVLLISHNRIDLTSTAIKALYDYTLVPFHLIVIDDSVDATPYYIKQLQAEKDNITFVHSDEPFKTGNQIFNLGLKHCQNEFVCTVMNSVRVEPEWEIVALQVMKMNPKIGVVGFKCLKETGLIESAGLLLDGWMWKDIGHDMPGHQLTFVSKVDAVQWAFALLRKKAVIGNLDENLFHGFRGMDDIDNCMVVKSKGWDIFYCGLGAGYHRTMATRNTPTDEGDRQNKENQEIFYKRWGLWEKFLKDKPDYKELTNYPVRRCDD